MQIIEHISKAIKIHPNAIQNHAARQPARGTHPRSGQPDFQPTSQRAQGIHDRDRSAQPAYPVNGRVLNRMDRFPPNSDMFASYVFFYIYLRAGDEVRIFINQDGQLIDRMSEIHAKTNKGLGIDEITLVYLWKQQILDSTR